MVERENLRLATQDIENHEDGCILKSLYHAGIYAESAGAILNERNVTNAAEIVQGAA